MAAERLLVFDRHFLEDLAHCVTTDLKVALKVLELVEATAVNLLPGWANPSRFAILGQAFGPGASPRNTAWFTK